MSLRLRRQPLNFPHDDPDARWSVYCEGVSVGVILLTKHRSDQPPTWDWHVHLYAAPIGSSLRQHAPIEGREDTREAAMVAFRASWEMLRAAIGDDGWRRHLDHWALLEAQQRQRDGTQIRSRS